MKHRILELHMARQTLLYAIRFLQYLITSNSKLQSPEIHETLATRLSQLYEIDVLLFTSIDLPYFEMPECFSQSK